MSTAFQSENTRGLMGSEVIVRRVIACEPSFQGLMCGGHLMRVDLFQFGVIHREFQPQIVWVGMTVLPSGWPRSAQAASNGSPMMSS